MEDIKKKLFELQDKKYQEFHSKLCPNIDNIIGVRVPKLREIAKKIAKDSPADYLSNVEKEYYEEKMIYGMVIGYSNMKIEERIYYLDKFIKMIHNWAACDCCCSTFKFTVKNMDEMFKYLCTYLNSNKEFELRFVIVMLMDYFLNEKYIKEVLRIYNNIHTDLYYANMGIAWGISNSYIKFPKITLEFIKNCSFDNFTYNKSIQKIIESNRVTKEEKDMLRKLKK